MKNTFTISAAYNWSKDTNGKNKSELAIKAITNHIKSRFTNNINEKLNYKINYKRLRASAGRNMLDSIINRIETSNVVIIDLTVDNNNLYLEAGIALALIAYNKYLSVYFIREKNSDKKLPDGIPTDLHGYYISEYVFDIKNNKILFKDNNSLRMSIESDVKDYFNTFNESKDFIDEIEYKDNE
jgi:hypothetical protein